jgi:pimeloyl-ACP methyl ester carboxylesterase
LPRKTTKAAARPATAKRRKRTPRPYPKVNTSSFWTEALFGAEILLLHATPVYYGLGVPRGDGSAVVIIPGFLGTDLYLTELHAWLRRIGYRPYFSGIGLNAECPNLLIQRRLNQTIEKALSETGRKIHLIGHSLGGVIARSVAGDRPKDVASVITLAAPIRGTVANRAVLRAAEAVRLRILEEHGKGVLPDCYTGRCTCNFLDSLHRKVAGALQETAIYTRQDGIVDWRYCMTLDPEKDVEVPGTHIGMAFNPAAYTVVAERLARAQSRESVLSPPSRARRLS